MVAGSTCNFVRLKKLFLMVFDQSSLIIKNVFLKNVFPHPTDQYISGGMPPEGLQKQPILIVTAHMHWDPEFSDVKLIQTMMLMSELKRIVEESYHLARPSAPTNVSPDCNTIPMILCGDLNSLPQSGTMFYPCLSSGLFHSYLTKR